jgi:nucleotide-binding universal stress UspA family protein
MPKAKSLAVPIIQNVFHPSDFSPAGEAAFVHALKAALTAKANFTILHVAPNREMEWTDFPGVRATLERWGLLPKQSSQADVSKLLGIKVKKVVTIHRDPVRAVMAYLATHSTDMIVLATDQSKGRVRWLRKSVAEPLARRSRLMTLFVPKETDGFVSIKDGSIALKSILIPVAADPPAQAAIQAAVRLAYRLGGSDGRFTVLHVGEEGAMPVVRYPALPGWRWNKITKSGQVIEVILQTAWDVEADLIVMSTDGRHGFLDALRGSHSERVLHGSPCPLLAIPAGGFTASMLQAESG